jgi:hypothetical protein
MKQTCFLLLIQQVFRFYYRKEFSLSTSKMGKVVLEAFMPSEFKNKLVLKLLIIA